MLSHIMIPNSPDVTYQQFGRSAAASLPDGSVLVPKEKIFQDLVTQVRPILMFLH